MHSFNYVLAMMCATIRGSRATWCHGVDFQGSRALYIEVLT